MLEVKPTAFVEKIQRERKIKVSVNIKIDLILEYKITERFEFFRVFKNTYKFKCYCDAHGNNENINIVAKSKNKFVDRVGDCVFDYTLRNASRKGS